MDISVIFKPTHDRSHIQATSRRGPTSNTLFDWHTLTVQERQTSNLQTLPVAAAWSQTPDRLSRSVDVKDGRTGCIWEKKDEK